VAELAKIGSRRPCFEGKSDPEWVTSVASRAFSIAIDASWRGESVTLGENEVVGDRSELWMN